MSSARLYVELEAFSVVAELLPEKLLDEITVSLLTRSQIQRVLLDKVEHLETVQVELRKARDGLEEKVNERTGKLRDANQLLQAEIEMRKSVEDQLTHLASHDPLTDLFNRRRFEEELNHQLAWAQRHGTHGAVFWLDLDGFKAVNDTLGHRVGDKLLVSLTDLLRKQVRKTDVLARLGGDEFAILCPQISAEQAQMLARKILEKVRRHAIIMNGQLLSAAVSIGIALFPDHGNSEKTLLAHADLALYRAKGDGRNGFCLYTPEKDRSDLDTYRWERQIRVGLEEWRFLHYFQPILDLRTDRIVTHELLLRMKGEQGEIISPGGFMSVAERCGMMSKIDRWVMRRAIHLIANQGLCLGVNLSAKAFSDTELLLIIRQELVASGIDPASLMLEITESAAVPDLDQAKSFIDTQKVLGCRFALDDFGVGFSSFYNLKHLKMDYLKIDGHFIRELPRNFEDQQLVKAMVEMAHGLGIEVVAEHVEDKETLQLLREYGADYGQGDYSGQPIDRALFPSQARADQ